MRWWRSGEGSPAMASSVDGKRLCAGSRDAAAVTLNRVASRRKGCPQRDC